MLLIAIIGYGKMGKLIEEVAVQKGHKIILKVNSANKEDLNYENLLQADIAIEFTNPADAYNNVKKCLDNNIPVVSGSTGWNEGLEEIKKICREKKGSFLHSSNFSIGVNIFFEVNTQLAHLMASQNNYEINIKEVHHTQKKDAPSGTAVTLAEQLLGQIKRKKYWVNNITGDENAIEIISERVDAVAGTHLVKYSSSIDDIEIIHTAHNRLGFAAGAVLAAEYVYKKKGIFSMKDVLSL